MILSNSTPIPLQALAENTPILSTGYWYADDTLTTLAQHATYSHIYRTQPVVSGVIDKISESMAQLTLNVFDISDPDNDTKVPDSDYAKLLRDPCPIMRPYEFYRYMMTTYELHGEAYAIKVRAGGPESKVIGLVPMHPSRVAVKRDEQSNETFVFTMGVASAGILTVDRSEVLAWRRFNESHIMRGESRLRSLQTTMVNEEAARAAISSWWLKGGAPSGVLSVADGKLSDTSRTRLKAQFDDRHSGANKMGGTVLLEAGTTYQPLMVNAEQLQFIETRKYDREEIFSRFDIPPPVMQITDNATFSNITEQFRSLYRESLSYRIVDFQDLLDGDLRPEFAKSGKLYAKLDQDEALLGPVETRAQVAVSLVVNGIAKPSEVRPWFAFSKLGDDNPANALYANQALAPLGSAPVGTAAPGSAATGEAPAPTGDPGDPFGVNNAPDAPSTPTDPPKDTPPPPEVTTRALMGRLGLAVKSGDQLELRKKLLQEHGTALSVTVAAQKGAAIGPQNAALAKTLATLTGAAVSAAGSQAARSLGGSYDNSQLTPYIQKAAQSTAERFNEATQAELDGKSGDDVTAYYEDVMPSRVSRLAETLVTQFTSLAVMTAGKQLGAANKTWRTSDANSRHVALNGETVGIDDEFSNGMGAPGDPHGGLENTADCRCTLDVSR